MGPRNRGFLQLVEVLRRAGSHIEGVEFVEQVARVEDRLLGLLAELLREFIQTLFLRDHGALPEIPAQEEQR